MDMKPAMAQRMAEGNKFHYVTSLGSPSSMEVSNTETNKYTSKSKKFDLDDNDDKDITTKSLFEMASQMEGLPNELAAITTSMRKMVRAASIPGFSSTYDLHSIYLNVLGRVKMAKYNKDKFDAAYEHARENGSLNEYAISGNGEIYIQDAETGEFGLVSLQQLQDNRDKYIPITASTLAYLRAYDPSMTFSPTDEVFNVLNNNMSYKVFQELLDKAKGNLGKYETTQNTIRTEQALVGQQELEGMDQSELAGLLDEASENGYVDTKHVSKSNMENIKAYVNYLVGVLPDNAKIWAALKTGDTDRNAGATKLVWMYLSGQIDESMDVTSTLHTGKAGTGTGTGKKNQTPAEKERDFIDKMNQGWWSKVQTDQGGDNASYSLVRNNGEMSVNGVYYGQIGPKDPHATSLSEFCSSQNFGAIRGAGPISFGSLKVDNASLDHIMVDPRYGAMTVTLPCKGDGTVDFDLLEDFNKMVEDVFAKTDYSYDSDGFKKELAKRMENDDRFKDLVNGSGMPDKKHFKHYYVMTGYITDNADVTDKDGKKVKMKKGLTDWTIPVDEDATLNEIRNALSVKGLDNKVRGYKFRGGMFDGPKAFKGNIYIPLSENLIAGSMGDNITSTWGENHAMTGAGAALDDPDLAAKIAAWYGMNNE